MTQKKETIESKLRLLYNLQLIDSCMDRMRDLRGELPMEIENLNQEITQKKEAIQKADDNFKEVQDDIKFHKNLIEESKVLSKKYSDQQKNVRNNREYNSISKEIEYQDLEIQLAEKNIKKFELLVEKKKEEIKVLKADLKTQETLLSSRNSDLGDILEDTKKEEKKLLKKAEEYRKQTDEKLLRVYDKLRGNLKNGLAVVSIERGASVGSFIMMPPQIQVEVAARKRIIIDEYSSRILVDPELAEEETKKMAKILKG